MIDTTNKLAVPKPRTNYLRRNYLTTLQEELETDNYSNLVQAAREASMSVLPPVPRRNRQVPWNDADVQELRKEKQQARTKSAKQTLSKKLSDLYARKVTEHIVKKCKIVETAHPAAEYKVAWNALKEISGTRKPNPPRIKGGNPQERKARWQAHFQTLLNVQPSSQNSSQPDFNPVTVSDPLPISTDPISLEELNSALKKIKIKAPGGDEIPGEFFKSGIASVQLLNIMNLAFKTGTAPQEWTKSVIIPIPKQGDHTDPTNYRGISLTSLAAKTYNRILIDRAKPHVDPLLGRNQNGF